MTEPKSDKVADRQHVLVDAAKFRIFKSWNPGSARLWPGARLHDGQHARARDKHMHAVEYAPPLSHVESVQEERFEVAPRLRLTGCQPPILFSVGALARQLKRHVTTIRPLPKVGATH